jgi:hypothetical protein
MLNDPVREAFAQEYIKHSNASEALRTVKPAARMWKAETVHKRASEMLLSGEVQGRLQQLQAETAVKHNVTMDSIMAELEEARKIAIANPRTVSAAVSASMGKAKIAGLIVDKAEHTGADGAPLVPVLNVSLSRN